MIADLLADAAGMARRGGRVVYVIGGEVTTAKPEHGPYVMIWPSGARTYVGHERTSAERRR